MLYEASAASRGPGGQSHVQRSLRGEGRVLRLTPPPTEKVMMQPDLYEPQRQLVRC